ncbi:hypothetical protein KQI41_01285 [Tissierella pigra]|uniref:hypothetical protein n=1 Tax=Tissierella pigra TaxID=2607614 RepID=UPI001C11CA1B|nr:hypothetical protein [Tissierella pigra]MBU5425029.1 hypothetical protein [Tissierella pigra]
MKKMFIEAHKMTREMVEKYGVDYQAQFGLSLSYLLEMEEKEMLKELTGTPKQIAWANDIRKDLIEKFEKLEVADRGVYIDMNTKLSPNARISLSDTNIAITPEIVTEMKNYMLETKTDAKWYIETRSEVILPIIKKLYIDEMIRNRFAETGEKVQIIK